MTIIDPLKDLPGYALRRASLAVMGELAERLKGLALRPTEATVILVIEANPGVTQSEVGELLEVARANMAPLTARLLERDLVLRQRVDGRSQGMSLSAAGRRMARKIRRAIAEQEASILKRIPAKDAAGFLTALQTLWKPQAERALRTPRRPPQKRLRSAKRG
jgi:DNA-binding MarR family transcriptional regulator